MDMIENDQLLEYAEYVGNYYGTPRDFVEETLATGRILYWRSKCRAR